jgi:hypothetical protein
MLQQFASFGSHLTMQASDINEHKPAARSVVD